MKHLLLAAAFVASAALIGGGAHAQQIQAYCTVGATLDEPLAVEEMLGSVRVGRSFESPLQLEAFEPDTAPSHRVDLTGSGEDGFVARVTDHDGREVATMGLAPNETGRLSLPIRAYSSDMEDPPAYALLSVTCQSGMFAG